METWNCQEQSLEMFCFCNKLVFLKRRTGVSEPAVHISSTQNRCFWLIHNIHSKNPVLESIFNKVAVLRASNTGAFPWSLQTFQKQLFWRAPVNVCFSFLCVLWIIQEHLFSRGATNGYVWNTSEGVFH